MIILTSCLFCYCPLENENPYNSLVKVCPNEQCGKTIQKRSSDNELILYVYRNNITISYTDSTNPTECFFEVFSSSNAYIPNFMDGLIPKLGQHDMDRLLKHIESVFDSLVFQ